MKSYAILFCKLAVLENQSNMKKKLILLSVLGGFVFLIFGNLFKAGSGHVEVVEKVEVLQVENQKLSTENQTLHKENTKLKVATDSLITKHDSLTETVETLSTEVNEYETKLEKVSKPVNAVKPSVVTDQPYDIVIPIETEVGEAEVSSSPH